MILLFLLYLMPVLLDLSKDSLSASILLFDTRSGQAASAQRVSSVKFRTTRKRVHFRVTSGRIHYIVVGQSTRAVSPMKAVEYQREKA